MNTQEKLNKIYEVIADKTLSFGCKVKHIKNEVAEYNKNKYCKSDTHGIIVFQEDEDGYELEIYKNMRNVVGGDYEVEVSENYGETRRVLTLDDLIKELCKQ